MKGPNTRKCISSSAVSALDVAKVCSVFGDKCQMTNFPCGVRVVVAMKRIYERFMIRNDMKLATFEEMKKMSDCFVNCQRLTSEGAVPHFCKLELL